MTPSRTRGALAVRWFGRSRGCVSLVDLNVGVDAPGFLDYKNGRQACVACVAGGRVDVHGGGAGGGGGVVPARGGGGRPHRRVQPRAGHAQRCESHPRLWSCRKQQPLATPPPYIPNK